MDSINNNDIITEERINQLIRQINEIGVKYGRNLSKEAINDISKSYYILYEGLSKHSQEELRFHFAFLENFASTFKKGIAEKDVKYSSPEVRDISQEDINNIIQKVCDFDNATRNKLGIKLLMEIDGLLKILKDVKSDYAKDEIQIAYNRLEEILLLAKTLEEDNILKYPTPEYKVISLEEIQDILNKVSSIDSSIINKMGPKLYKEIYEHYDILKQGLANMCSNEEVLISYRKIEELLDTIKVFEEDVPLIHSNPKHGRK